MNTPKPATVWSIWPHQTGSDERAVLETGLRRHEAFTRRRCQIGFARAEGQKPAPSATTLHAAPQTRRNVMHAFDARGLAWVPHGATVPLRVEPVLNAETREPCRAIGPQSPRTFGQPARVWTLHRLADVWHEPGLSAATLSAARPCWMPSAAWGAVGHAPHTGWSVPDPADERKKTRRDRLIRMAANHPHLVLGFAADVWWSREAQPPRHAWSDDPPRPPGGTDRYRPRTPRAQRWPVLVSMCPRRTTGCGAVGGDVPSAWSPAPFSRGWPRM